MAPPLPRNAAWYLLSRTMIRCTRSSGTRLALAWVAIMVSYLARWASAACGKAVATMAASQASRTRHFMIKAPGRRDWRANASHTVIVAIAGQGCGQIAFAGFPGCRFTKNYALACLPDQALNSRKTLRKIPATPMTMSVADLRVEASPL